MELSVIKKDEWGVVVLLDDNMRIVKPVQKYLNKQAQMCRSFNTLVANGRDLKLYWEFLKHKGYDYTQITPVNIGEFIEYLRLPDGADEKIVILYGTSKRTGKTVNRILSTVYCFYKFCCLVLEIKNPIMMEEINRPQNMFKSLLHHARRSNTTQKSIFKIKESDAGITLITDDQVELILDSLLRERDRLIFKILYLTGARISEVLNLKIENIPYPDTSETFGVLKSIKSKGKVRDLFIPSVLVEEIDNFIINERTKIETDHSFLFVSMQKEYFGKPLTYRGIYEVFSRVKKKLGIDFNFHAVRHTFITHLAETGMDVSIISKIAGHRHVSTTEQYTHLSDGYVGKSLERYWNNSILLGGVRND